MHIDVHRQIKQLRARLERQVHTPEDLRSQRVLRLSRRIDRLVMRFYYQDDRFPAGTSDAE